MLGILLTVLKVIGIALLILLALLLLIILIVLFVPVRYSAKGSYLKKVPKAYIKVTYLLYILYIKLLYDKKPDLTVRIFGIKLNLKKFKKKKNVKAEAKPKEDNKKASGKEESSTKPVRTDSGKIEAEGSAESEVHTSEDDTSSKPSREDKKEDSKNKKKEASKENKESEETEKISLQEKISKKKEDIEAIIDLLTSDSAKRAFFVSKKRIAKAIGSILPHKGHIYAKIGLSNAGTTGKILGIYKALYDYVGNTVTFIPVFDEEIIEVEFDLKGKIRAATVLYHLICIYIDKDCRKIIKTIIRKVKKKG